MDDFTNEEISAVKSTLFERYKAPIDIDLADSELRLDPDSPQMTLCPTIYWQVEDCHFVICKVASEKFHCQFFYSKNEQFGTGIREYNDIVECAVSLLRVQADHESTRSSTS